LHTEESIRDICLKCEGVEHKFSNTSDISGPHPPSALLLCLAVKDDQIVPVSRTYATRL